MKKLIYMLLLNVGLLIMLTSCGVPNPPDENAIAQNIPEEVKTVIIDNPFDATNSDVYVMDVKSVSIEKRQTNEKEDIAYCNIELENDYYSFTKFIITYYNYYDKGGWILDRYSEYDESIWEIKGCPFSNDVVAYAVNDYTIIDADEPEINANTGNVKFIYNVKDIYENVTSEGTVEVNLQFDGSGWTYDINTDSVELSWNVLGHWYSSVYGGIYLDINELTDAAVSIEVIYEDTAKDALAGNRGPLIDVSDERYWHLKTQSTDIWEKYTDTGEPYLHFQFYFESWSDTWNIYILKDSALAQVRRYPNTELYRVESNPFVANLKHTGDESALSNNTPDPASDADIATWNRLIEQYFAMMESSDDPEVILARRLEVGPYGDEICIIGEPVQQYKVIETEHSNEFYTKAYEEIGNDIEITKLSLKELRPDFVDLSVDDIALLHVQAEFSNQNIGIVEYQFWFVKSSGTWMLFFVDITER